MNQATRALDHYQPLPIPGHPSSASLQALGQGVDVDGIFQDAQERQHQSASDRHIVEHMNAYFRALRPVISEYLKREFGTKGFTERDTFHSEFIRDFITQSDLPLAFERFLGKLSEKERRFAFAYLELIEKKEEPDAKKRPTSPSKYPEEAARARPHAQEFLAEVDKEEATFKGAQGAPIEGGTRPPTTARVTPNLAVVASPKFLMHPLLAIALEGTRRFVDPGAQAAISKRIDGVGLQSRKGLFDQMEKGKQDHLFDPALNASVTRYHQQVQVQFDPDRSAGAGARTTKGVEGEFDIAPKGDVMKYEIKGKKPVYIVRYWNYKAKREEFLVAESLPYGTPADRYQAGLLSMKEAKSSAESILSGGSGRVQMEPLAPEGEPPAQARRDSLRGEPLLDIRDTFLAEASGVFLYPEARRRRDSRGSETPKGPVVVELKGWPTLRDPHKMTDAQLVEYFNERIFAEGRSVEEYLKKDFKEGIMTERLAAHSEMVRTWIEDRQVPINWDKIFEALTPDQQRFAYSYFAWIDKGDKGIADGYEKDGTSPGMRERVRVHAESMMAVAASKSTERLFGEGRITGEGKAVKTPSHRFRPVIQPSAHDGQYIPISQRFDLHPPAAFALTVLVRRMDFPKFAAFEEHLHEVNEAYRGKLVNEMLSLPPSKVTHTHIHGTEYKEITYEIPQELDGQRRGLGLEFIVDGVDKLGAEAKPDHGPFAVETKKRPYEFSVQGVHFMVTRSKSVTGYERPGHPTTFVIEYFNYKTKRIEFMVTDTIPIGARGEKYTMGLESREAALAEVHRVATSYSQEERFLGKKFPQMDQADTVKQLKGRSGVLPAKPQEGKRL